MSDELGLVNYSDRSLSSGSRSLVEGREYSEATAEKIDNEIRHVMDRCYKEAKQLLQEHEEDVRLIVEALMEFEVLAREEFDLLLESRTCDSIREYRNNPRKAFGHLHEQRQQEEEAANAAQADGEGDA